MDFLKTKTNIRFETCASLFILAFCFVLMGGVRRHETETRGRMQDAQSIALGAYCLAGIPVRLWLGVGVFLSYGPGDTY